MKQYDEKTEEAFVFYGHMVLEQECVIDTDEGLIQEDGTPVFEHMRADIVDGLHEDNIFHREVLANHNIDAQEVMQFFEMCLITSKVLGEKYEPPHLLVSKIGDLAGEGETQRNERRAHHLFQCLQQCVVASEPSSIFVSDDTKGFAIDANNCHPLIRLYVQSMSRYDMNDAIRTGEAEMFAEDVVEYLNEQTAAFSDKKDIDPDSDENDDDPFRGYA